MNQITPNALPTPHQSAPGLSFEATIDALRTLRLGGGIDEATTGFRLPPAVRSAVSPAIAAMRWGAVLFGMVFAAPAASDGDLAMVATLSIALFFTSWRTFRPIRLASERTLDLTLSITDIVIIGIATGWSGGPVSPFVFCVVAAVVVASFGWEVRHGVLAFIAATVSTIGSAYASGADPEPFSQQALTIMATMITIIMLMMVLRTRLLEGERRRQALSGRVDALMETNDLLAVLNRVARTLPSALDHREAIAAARRQIDETFGPTTTLLLARSPDGAWVPQITEQVALPARFSDGELPTIIAEACRSPQAILSNLENGEAINQSSKCGMYTALRSRGELVGVLGIEHRTLHKWAARDQRILDGLADVLGLTIDNARWFRRLRSLGAEEERGRIARDLHDRLGQWLTYISLELERITSDDLGVDAELVELQSDVQRAIDELRDTLRELRASVTVEDDFETVAGLILESFQTRRSITTHFLVSNPGQRLGVAIEQELFRLLQESLNNIDRHANATEVTVLWAAAPPTATLTITDNGQGFDTQRSTRSDAYGLIGMHERADAIDGRLSIRSHPGEGTTVAISIDTAGVLK